MNVLHILPRLTGGGPARSLIALVKAQARLGLPYRHRLVTLKRDAYPPTLVDAKNAGMEIVRAPDCAAFAREIESADLVTIHFWNTPELYAALQEELPPARLLIWSTILGDPPPQVLIEPLAVYVDWFIATDEASLSLPALDSMVRGQRAGAIPSVPDFERIAELRPREHTNFNVGYIGTVNANKLHPNFVAMSAAVEVPGVRFVVCGGNEETIGAQAAELGVSEKFQLLGFVEDIGSVLETLDVFGYPLTSDNYSTTDLALQEAMYAGIPPVVFPHGGVGRLVRHNETGLIVNDVLEYKRAIEFLYRHPDERKRLGEKARDYVRTQLSDEYVAREFDAAFAKAMQLPKRVRPALFAGYGPARLFAATLGKTVPSFEASLSGVNEEAEAQIARSSTALAMGEGGIFHYRNTYPDDPYLRFWAGLVLNQQGRRALARDEFRAALSLGLDAGRVSKYIS